MDNTKQVGVFCKCCDKPPKQGIIQSNPSIGGEWKTPNRQYVVETAENTLRGICETTGKLTDFFTRVHHDTFVKSIDNIMILKAMMGDEETFENGEITEHGHNKLNELRNKYQYRNQMENYQ